MHTVPGAMQRLQQLYAEGEAAMQAGDLPLAVAKFSEGLEIDDHFRQRYVTMYAQRAFCLQKMGEAEKAIPDYTRAIEMEPPVNQAQYYFHRGMCFARRKDGTEQALADYGASIELYNEHPGPFHLRAKILVDLERWGEAEADLNRVLQLAPNGECFALRGWVRYQLGRGQEALPDFASANEMSGFNPNNSYVSACIHARSGNLEALAAEMTATLSADGSFAELFATEPDFESVRGTPQFQQVLKNAQG